MQSGTSQTPVNRKSDVKFAQNKGDNKKKERKIQNVLLRESDFEVAKDSTILKIHPSVHFFLVENLLKIL